MNRKEAVELAKIVGKAESGKKLTPHETLVLLPYAIVKDVDDMMEEYKKYGKIKPRRRLKW